MSAYSLNAPRSEKYPYGGYSPEGDPVCHDHRQVRCYGCGLLFQQHLMRRHVVGTREDRVLREGMRPRIEEAFGSFCPHCDASRCGRRDSQKEVGAVNPRIPALIVSGAFAAGFITLMWALLSLL